MSVKRGASLGPIENVLLRVPKVMTHRIFSDHAICTSAQRLLRVGVRAMHTQSDSSTYDRINPGCKAIIEMLTRGDEVRKFWH